jgi:hypothetical protein
VDVRKEDTEGLYLIKFTLQARKRESQQNRVFRGLVNSWALININSALCSEFDYIPMATTSARLRS